jgi:2-amino-4-hydroxy-6-hydroxymethyldihydropteridine diphosphokinase
VAPITDVPTLTLQSRSDVRAYIAIGANLGDAQQQVVTAARDLQRLGAAWVCSSLYRTAPQGASGPDYVNAVVGLDTLLTAPDLLDELQRLELAAGRERPYPNAPRTLDLDIILYGDARIDSARLQVPHPRMWSRAFVLVPLQEIAPNRVDARHLHALADQAIRRI